MEKNWGHGCPMWAKATNFCTFILSRSTSSHTLYKNCHGLTIHLTESPLSPTQELTTIYCHLVHHKQPNFHRHHYLVHHKQPNYHRPPSPRPPQNSTTIAHHQPNHHRLLSPRPPPSLITSSTCITTPTSLTSTHLYFANMTKALFKVSPAVLPLITSWNTFSSIDTLWTHALALLLSSSHALNWRILLLTHTTWQPLCFTWFEAFSELLTE